MSANTVSRALANKDGVSARTRDIVAREAERLGYIPPSATATRRAARTVALVVTSSTNVFISRLITAVEATLRAQGFSLQLFVTEESMEVERQTIERLAGAAIAGAIVIPVQGPHSPWASVADDFGPIVAVAREIPGLETDLVAMDQQAAMYALTRHTLAQGARALYFFDEDLDVSSNRDRVRSFEAAVATNQAAVGRVISIPTRRFESRTHPWQPEEAYRAVNDILAAGERPDALLFEDDYYALGAIRALTEHGLCVPDDALVLGYGDHPYSSYLRPALTTVSVPTRLIAEAAVSLLARRIAGDTGPATHRLVGGELVVRESSVGLAGRAARHGATPSAPAEVSG